MRSRIVLIFLILAAAISVPACGKFTGITTPLTTPQPSVLSTPITQPGDLVIASTNAFVDAYGTYHVVGEIDNNSSSVVNAVQLTIEIKDASGTSMLKGDDGNITPSAIVYPMIYTLAPGASSPFDYTFDTTNGLPATYNVTISGQQNANANPATLQWENILLTDDESGWLFLTGKLVNTGNQWAHINGLAGAILDDSNKLLSANWTSTYTTELAPAGDSNSRDRTPFAIKIPNPSGGTQWQLYKDVDVTENVIDFPMEISISNGYSDQYGSYHVVGWITNNSDQPLDTLVVAGLYSSDTTVLDSSYAFVPVPVIPGGTAPFNVSSFDGVNGNQDQISIVSTFSAQFDNWFTSPSLYDFVELSATGETVQKDGSSWTFNGTVTNSSDKSLSRITVMVKVMDSQNNLVAMEYSTIYPAVEAIAAGETSSYSVSVDLDPAVDASAFSTTTVVVGDIK
jgi:hypothetical protein